MSRAGESIVPDTAAGQNLGTERIRRRRRWLPWFATTLFLAACVGVAVHFYERRGEPAPPANLLPLGAGMRDLATQTVFDSVTAGEGGPRQYYRNLIIDGPRAVTTEHLIRREIAVLEEHGWDYSGSIGGTADDQAILVRAGTSGATSYVFNTTHQVCAVLSAYTEDDSPRVRLSASTTDADPLWVELSHDQDDIDCSLPTLMRKDSIP